MSRSLRHGALAATAVAFSIASLSACGAGLDAESLQIRPDNAATAVDEIRIQNANVVTQPESGAKGPAVVTATVFNNGTEPETLEAITLPGTGTSVDLHTAKGKGPIVVPAGGQVILGGKGNAAAVIKDGSEAAQNGNVQEVVFKFSKTGDIGLGASVVPAAGFFKGWGPSALPSAEPSDSPSEGASETSGESGAPSTTPSDTESGTATPAGEESTESAGH